MKPETLARISEAQLQATVIGLLDTFKWTWVHHRPARTKSGAYVNAVSGSGAKGWPDIFAVRGTDAVAWELKSQLGRPTKEQFQWLADLNRAGIEARVIRPSDLDYVEDRLRPDPVQMAMDTITTNSTSSDWLPLTPIAESST